MPDTDTTMILPSLVKVGVEVGHSQVGRVGRWWVEAGEQVELGSLAGEFVAVKVAGGLTNPAPRAARGRGRTLYFMGWLAYLEGDDSRAAGMLRDSAELLRGIGDRRSFVNCLDVLACVAARTSDHVLALRLLTAGRRIRATTGARRHSYLAEQCPNAETIALAALPPAVADRTPSSSSPLIDCCAAGVWRLCPTDTHRGSSRSPGWLPRD